MFEKVQSAPVKESAALFICDMLALSSLNGLTKHLKGFGWLDNSPQKEYSISNLLLRQNAMIIPHL